MGVGATSRQNLGFGEDRLSRICDNEGPPRDVIYYDDGRSVFAHIRHPSSPQFRQKEWPARVHGLIERSVQPRTLGQKTLWQP